MLARAEPDVEADGVPRNEVNESAFRTLCPKPLEDDSVDAATALKEDGGGANTAYGFVRRGLLGAAASIED